MSKKQYELREFVCSAEMRIDRDKCLLRNVKVLGYDSKNGRRYTEAAAKAAMAMYSGVPVNVNHTLPANDGRERPIEDRFGWLENIRQEKDGLYGDLRFLKSDPRAEKVAEIAEANPGLIGLSHHAYGTRRTDKDGQVIVEQILRVKSVDLVCDPATTRGLFESERFMEDEMGAAATAGSGDMTWDVFIAEAKKAYDGEGDAATKAKTVGALAKKLFKLADELASVTNPEKPEMPAEEKAAEEATRKQATEFAALKEQLRAMQAKEANAALLESVGVKPDAFKLAALDKMPTAEARKTLAESWKTVGAATKPRSAGPLYESVREDDVYKPLNNTKEFAALLR